MKNLQFALTIEQKNARIAEKLSWAQNQRKSGLPTVPSTIEEELETNPFIRVDLPELQVFFLSTNILKFYLLTASPFANSFNHHKYVLPLSQIKSPLYVQKPNQHLKTRVQRQVLF